MHRGWKDFTTDEMRQYMGLYILDGVSPLPRVDMKVQSQADDPVNANVLCHENFGSNATN